MPADDEDQTLLLSIESPGVLRVCGELDAHTAKALHTALEVLMTDDAVQTVAVDMSEIAFMDSSGLGALIHAYKRGEKVNKAFRVQAPSPAVVRILEITGQFQRFVGDDATRHAAAC